MALSFEGRAGHLISSTLNHNLVQPPASNDGHWKKDDDSMLENGSYHASTPTYLQRVARRLVRYTPWSGVSSLLRTLPPISCSTAPKGAFGMLFIPYPDPVRLNLSFFSCILSVCVAGLVSFSARSTFQHPGCRWLEHGVLRFRKSLSWLPYPGR